MGIMKDFDIRIRNGGDDAIAAASEFAMKAARLAHGFVPAWIPVTERLPKEGDQVIVWMPDCPHHPCGMDMGSCMTDSWGVSWMVSGGRSAFPTHWMPLPAPPKNAE